MPHRAVPSQFGTGQIELSRSEPRLHVLSSRSAVMIQNTKNLQQLYRAYL